MNDVTTYTAWDGIEYPLPTPDGWYRATDGRWWPDGHGPGPTEAVVESSPASETGVGATDTSIPDALRGPASAESAPSRSADELADSSLIEQTQAKRPPRDLGRKLVRVIVAAGLLLLFGSVGYLVFLGGDDEPEAADATATTQVITDGAADAAAETGDAGPTTTAVPSKGTAQDPYTVGEKIVLRYEAASGEGERVWEVVVLDAPSDRTEAVLEENQFNEPPEGGTRFVVVPLSVTYVSGPAPASLFDLNFKVVGPSAVVFTTFDPSCGVVPDAIDSLGELFPGGRLEGNICWVVPSDDIGSLTMLVEAFLINGETYVDLTAS